MTSAADKFIGTYLIITSKGRECIISIDLSLKQFKGTDLPPREVLHDFMLILG